MEEAVSAASPVATLTEPQKAVASYLLAKMEATATAYQEAQAEYQRYIQAAAAELGVKPPIRFDAKQMVFVPVTEEARSSMEDRSNGKAQ